MKYIFIKCYKVYYSSFYQVSHPTHKIHWYTSEQHPQSLVRLGFYITFENDIAFGVELKTHLIFPDFHKLKNPQVILSAHAIMIQSSQHVIFSAHEFSQKALLTLVVGYSTYIPFCSVY